jgi:hypothetical protein
LSVTTIASGGSVTGDFTVSVDNPSAAIANVVFKGAIDVGIADVAGLPVSQVSSEVSLARRLAPARRTAGAIKVDYVIMVTDAQSSTDVIAQMTTVTKANLTNAINTAISLSSDSAAIESIVGVLAVIATTPPIVQEQAGEATKPNPPPPPPPPADASVATGTTAAPVLLLTTFLLIRD